MVEQFYTAEEVAVKCGLAPSTIRRYAAKKLISSLKEKRKDYLFTEEHIHTFLSKRASQAIPQKDPYENKQVLSQQEEDQKPPIQEQQEDDASILLTVLAEIFQFLASNQLPARLQSLREIAFNARLWEVETPGTDLHVLADGPRVIVLSDAYQKRLEDRIQYLQGALYEAETKLAYLRKKPRQYIIEDYAHPLSVFLETDERGVVIWCESFPFASRGKDEEEALSAFRRVLWGYTSWLHKHESKLSEELQKQFLALRDLLVEQE